MKGEIHPDYVNAIEAVTKSWLDARHGFIETVLTAVAHECAPLIAGEVQKGLLSSMCAQSHENRYEDMLRSLKWILDFIDENRTPDRGYMPKDYCFQLKYYVENAIARAEGRPERQPPEVPPGEGDPPW